MAKHIPRVGHTLPSRRACEQAYRPYRTEGRQGAGFFLQAYRPDGTRGKEAGMVFFGKHGGPPGRGLLRRGSRLVKNLEVDEACGRWVQEVCTKNRSPRIRRR